MKKLLIYTVLSSSMLFSASAYAEDYVVTLKDKQFSPQELVIPAGEKIKLIVKNEDTTPAEFESYALNREKIITGNSEAAIYVGPLKPGSYDYFNDFHLDTKGTITAK